MFRLIPFSRSKRGTAMAELAVVIPLLVVFIGTIYEVSRAYYLQHTIEWGAKEAAKLGTHFKIMSMGTTLNSSDIQSLVVNSVMVNGVIQDTSQFTIRYFTKGGTELMGATLPFDRTNNPTGSVDLVEVTVTYPGSSASVSTPVPALLNPADAFMGSIVLMARSVFQIDG